MYSARRLIWVDGEGMRDLLGSLHDAPFPPRRVLGQNAGTHAQSDRCGL